MAYLNHIPLHKWGKDHWSLLAYVESVSVECGGFEVGYDARMRHNANNFAFMNMKNPEPKRQNRPTMQGPVMDERYATRLNDGTIAPDAHDDWMCVVDMASAGLFTVSSEDVQPGAILSLSDKGFSLCSSLRKHKAQGGQFANFKPKTLVE